MAQVEFDRFGADTPGTGRFHEMRRQVQGALSLGAAASSVALIVGLGFWGYDIAVRDASGVPVVRAPEGPMRIAPANPGGDVAAHQGLAVNVVAALGVAQAPAERLVLAPRPRDLREDDAPGLAPPISAAMATALPGAPDPMHDRSAIADATTRDPLAGRALGAPAVDAPPAVDHSMTPAARIAGVRAADTTAPLWLRPPSAATTVSAASTMASPDRDPTMAVAGSAASGDPMGLAFRAGAAALSEPPVLALPSVVAVQPLLSATIDPNAVDRAMADALAGDAPVPDEAASLAPIDLVGSVRPRTRPVLETSEPAADPSLSELAEGVPEIAAHTLPVGTHLVQVGAFDDASAARGEWMRLSGRFGDLMTGKARVVQAAQSGGRTFFRLRATGFAGTDEARRFCSALRAEGADCIPVELR